MTQKNRTFLKMTRLGVTMVELLVAFCVVGVLGTLTVTAVGHARKSAYRADEVSSIRQLTQGYLLYANDNGGSLLPGSPSQEQLAMAEVKNHEGRPVLMGETKKRYTFRLLPYVGDIRLYYAGEAREFLNDVRGDGMEDYHVSLYPVFGLNRTYLGGNLENRRWDPAETLSQITAAYDPSNLIVFASTLHGLAGAIVSGAGAYPVGKFYCEAPNGESGSWGSYNEKSPASMGNIHLRHGGKALVSHLDGSTALLGEEELRDMRRWSNLAAMNGDRNHKPTNVRY